MPARHRYLISLLFGSIFGFTCDAQADAADKALAESLFREARELLDQGKAEIACPKFAESQRLDPALGTLLNLAECHAKVGRVASAWAEFRELAELSRQAGQSSRREYAQQRASELEKKLGYARLQLPQDANIVRIELDGRELGRAAWLSRLPLDPGAHSLVVESTSGVSRSSFRLPITPGEHPIVVTLSASPTPRETPAAAPGSEQAAPSNSVGDASSDLRVTSGYVGLGVGVLGLGASTYFTVRALSLKSESDDHCPAQRCDQEGVDRYRDARDAANLSTVSFVVGCVALASGGSLLLWASSDSSSGHYMGASGRF